MKQIVVVTMIYEVTDPVALQAGSAVACDYMNLGEGEIGIPSPDGWVHWCIAAAAHTISVPGTALLEHNAELGKPP